MSLPLGAGGPAPHAPRPPRRGRWVLALLLLLPVVELAVIVQVGHLLGVWPTVGLVVLGTVVGLQVVTRTGRSAFEALTARLATGAAPDGRQAGDAALVMLGGLLLAFPGFLTDVAGLLLLLPPTRSLARRGAARAARGRVSTVTVRHVGPPGRPAAGPQDGVVRGEVVDGDGTGIDRP